MAESSQAEDGFVSSLKKVAATLVAILQNRLDLVSLEAAEEKLRVVEALFLAVAFFFLALLGMLVLTFGLLFIVEPAWRPALLAAFVVVYLGTAAAAFFALNKRVKSWPTPFSGTVQEIKKDLECLRPKS
jgi:uncharacterized membrane protein YqjE